MKVTKYVSSNERWIKADVEIEKGTIYNLIIERVTMEDLENKGHVDQKPCLWFRSWEKGFPLNKTNAKMLVDIFGSDETDDWVGRKIQLYRTMTSSPTGMVPCIRIKPDDSFMKEQSFESAMASPPPEVDAGEVLADEDIPF